MRQQLRDELGLVSAGTGHPGLFMERYAAFELETGEVTPEEKNRFLKEVTGVPVPDVYGAAFRRWRQAVEKRCWTAEVEVSSRLLIGLGNHSPLEIGFTLHHTYGVPYLPGSALKGVLNHWIAEKLGPLDERWKGVTYDSGPVEYPGDWHGELFGRPVLDMNRSGSRGTVEFEDALYIPGSAASAGGADQPLATEVVTPHQFDYYSSEGEQPPNDWSSPQPHGFLSIRAPARFVLALSGPSDWASLALQHLLDALAPGGDESLNKAAGRGIGAKTAAGYGRLKLIGDIRLPDSATPTERSRWTEALAAQRQAAQQAREAATAQVRAAYESEQNEELRALIEDKVWNAASLNDRVKALLRLIATAVEQPGGKELVGFALDRLIERHGPVAKRRPSGLFGQLAALDAEWLEPRRK